MIITLERGVKIQEYSAGLMSQSFWLIEFKKLVLGGKTTNEIKAICIEENLLGTANAYRAKRIAGYMTN